MLKRKIVFLSICFIVFLCSGCYNTLESTTQTNISSSSELNSLESSSDLQYEKENLSLISQNNSWKEKELEKVVEQIVNSMSLEDKVAQIFIVTAEQLESNGEQKNAVTKADETLKESLQTYPVGGIILFTNNMVSDSQLKKLNQKMQNYSEALTGIPLFISVDEEGGSVARIANSGKFNVESVEDMCKIGQAQDEKRALEVGETIGSYLKELGFNMNFAPDADVLTNPQNTVVKKRSFGSDSALVTQLSQKVQEGLEKNSIYSVLKHFPGHGATNADTHEGLAYTDKNLDDLMKAELVPFQNAAKNGTSFIMASHISTPSVTGNNIPASLSKTMLTDVLREELGYEGIIITDALNMKAITDTYSSSDAAVEAIKAGADMLLMPDNFLNAYKGILEAVQNDKLSENQINQSVERILKAKLRLKKLEDVSVENIVALHQSNMETNWYEEYSVIAHALGEIDGIDYTNSKEAFKNSYKKGFRVFETDFSFTSDGKIVLWHDWEEDSGKYEKEKGKIPSFKYFMNSKICKKYTPLSLDDLVKLMEKYPDIYVVTDSKEENYLKVIKQLVKSANSKEDILNRVIIQIYDYNQYDEIQKIYPFKHNIFTIYNLADRNPERIGKFCSEKKIDVLGVPPKYATKEYTEELKPYGIMVYTYTINKEKNAKLYKDRGINGIYTDILTVF